MDHDVAPAPAEQAAGPGAAPAGTPVFPDPPPAAAAPAGPPPSAPPTPQQIVNAHPVEEDGAYFNPALRNGGAHIDAGVYTPGAGAGLDAYGVPLGPNGLPTAGVTARAYAGDDQNRLILDGAASPDGATGHGDLVLSDEQQRLRLQGDLATGRDPRLQGTYDLDTPEGRALHLQADTANGGSAGLVARTPMGPEGSEMVVDTQVTDITGDPDLDMGLSIDAKQKGIGSIAAHIAGQDLLDEERRRLAGEMRATIPTSQDSAVTIAAGGSATKDKQAINASVAYGSPNVQGGASVQYDSDGNVIIGGSVQGNF